MMSSSGFRELRDSFYENVILPQRRAFEERISDQLRPYAAPEPSWPGVKKMSVVIPMSREMYEEIREEQERWKPDLERLARMARGEEVTPMPAKKAAKKKTNKARKKADTKAHDHSAGSAEERMAHEVMNEPTPLSYAKGWDDGAKRWKRISDEALAGRQDKADRLEGILELIAIAHRTGGIYTVENLMAKTAKKEED